MGAMLPEVNSSRCHAHGDQGTKGPEEPFNTGIESWPWQGQSKHHPRAQGDWAFFCHLEIVTLGISGKCLSNIGTATISTPSIKQPQQHYAKTASAPWRTIMSSRAGPVPT